MHCNLFTYLLIDIGIISQLFPFSPLSNILMLPVFAPTSILGHNPEAGCPGKGAVVLCGNGETPRPHQLLVWLELPQPFMRG